MSQHLTSLESESEVKAFVMNNDLFEKKCESFKRQRNSIAVMIRQFETGSSQVKRMAAISEEKQREMKADVGRQHQKTESFLQDSMASINSAFESVDASRTTKRPLDTDSPAFLITLPYEEWIQKAERCQEELRRNLEELLQGEDALKVDTDDSKRREDVVFKAIGKAEKEANSLKEEILRQEKGMADLLKSDAEDQKKLQEATEEKEVEEKKKQETDEEVIAAEKHLNDWQKIAQEKELEDEKSRNEIADLESRYAKLASTTEFDPQLVSQLPDDDEINKIADEWAAFNSEREEQTANLPSLEISEITETETVDSMQVVLENVRKQKMEIRSEIEQVNVYKKKFIIADEMMSRKDSGYQAAVKQVEHNRSILNNLKVTANAAKPAKPTRTRSRQQKEAEALRQLEASNQDIPKGPSYRPLGEDYNTPRGAVQDDAVGKSVVQVLKQSSMESDFTRQVDTSGPHYPGIHIISQDTKKMSSNAVPEKENSAEENESPNIEDTTMRMDDTGTTQDESMMNGFFSPLKNASVKREPSPIIEFSMADHMNEFNKRQAEKKIATNVGKPARLDSEDVFNEKDDADSSLIAPDADEDELVIESDEEDIDYDDDLMAPEDQRDLNQSDWGSDD